MATSAFDRAGFAALSDLRAPGYAGLFARLESVQQEFLENLHAFADPKYPWDRDSLHNWSRVWEYPFVLHHVERECARLQRPPAVVDFGSGSTFFSFAVARLGTNLICCDNDPIVVGDLTAAANCIDAAPGTIAAQLSDERLPVPSGSADILYTVSVLEHMPEPVGIVREIARVLRPGALLIVTLDIDVEGARGVAPENFERLRRDLEIFFEPEFPDRSVHPIDVLTSNNGPCPRRVEPQLFGLLVRTADGRLRPLLGGPTTVPEVLTVYGAVLRRRAVPD